MHSPTPTADPSVPATATSGRFERIGMLGKGGMGIVWLAWDRERQQEVALKRVTDLRPEQLRRFKHGFRALQDIRHPGLARMYELGTDVDGPYLLMEPILGLDFLSYIHQPGDLHFEPPDPLAAARDLHESTSLVFHGTEPIRLEEIPRIEATGPLFEHARGGDEQGSTALLADTQPIVPPADDSSAPSSPRKRRPRPDRPPPPDDELERPPLNAARLAHVLPQLLEALSTLHRNGQIHRDLKPRNILVDASGNLKLLDFGVIADSGRPLQGTLCGTIGYIAPEEFSGNPPTSASDRYALGAILFRAFSGRPPFEGSRAEILRQTIRSRPPLLEDIAPWTPGDVSVLVDQLLHPVPAERPQLVEVATVFRRTFAARDLAVSAEPEHLLRSHDERPAQRLLEQLEANLQTRTRLHLLCSPQGTGKKMLLERVGNLAEGLGWAVLVGRGSLNDRVHFSAFDSVIDNLSVVLRHSDDDPLPPEILQARHILSHPFPVMRREGFAPDATTPDRKRIFQALHDVLAWLATQHPGVIILLHNVHLVDSDCELALEAVLRTPPPGLVVLASCPIEALKESGNEGRIPLLRRLLRISPDLHATHTLEPPSIDDLATRIAESIGDATAARRPHVRDLARACQGNPRLAELAGRLLAEQEAQTIPDNLWSTWVHHCWPGLGAIPIHLLGLLAAAAHPLSLDVLQSCANLPASAVYAAADELRNAQLIDIDGRDEPGSLVRIGSRQFIPVILDRISPQTLRRCRNAVIEHLLRTPGSDRPRLVQLLLDADRPEEASEHAALAAEEAAGRLAHGLAAEMVEIALRHVDDERAGPLHRLRAESLEASGDYAQACKHWLAVAGLHPDDSVEAHSARLAATASLLAANEPERAAEIIEHLGLHHPHRVPLGARLDGLIAGVLFRICAPASRLWRSIPSPSRRLPGPRKTSEDIDRLIRLAGLVGYYDPFQGLALFMHLVRNLARSGNVGGLSYALSILSYVAASSDRTPAGFRLAHRYRNLARHFVERADERARYSILLFDRFLDGHFALRRGLWTEAIAHFTAVDEALGSLGHQGTIDRALLWIQRGIATQCQQNLAAGWKLVRDMNHLFHDTGSVPLLGHIHFLEADLARKSGNLDGALTVLAEWNDLPAHRISSVQHAYGVCFAALATQGFSTHHVDRDLPRLREALRAARHFRLDRRASFHFVAGPSAVLEATAVRIGHPLADPDRCRTLARLALHSPPGHHAPALRSLAYLEDARRRPDRALSNLRQAEAIALQHDQRLDVAITRHQIGRRIGGEAGAAMTAGARQSILAEGASLHLLDEDPGPLA